MKNSEESQRTQAILEEFKEKRGASLMDRHVAKKADQPKVTSSGRRAFDRELVSYLSCKKKFHDTHHFLLELVICLMCRSYVYPLLPLSVLTSAPTSLLTPVSIPLPTSYLPSHLPSLPPSHSNSPSYFPSLLLSLPPSYPLSLPLSVPPGCVVS
jgi:hypothetical protein